MRYLALAAVISICGCNSIAGSFVRLKPDYSTLPADSLRAVARQIETNVQQGNRDEQVRGAEGVSVASDEIAQAIRTRIARAELVREFRASGHAWERRDGLLWVIPSGEYKRAGTKRDRDRNALLLNGENGSRWSLYEGLIEVNNWPPNALSAVQEIFAEARFEVLESGDKYEDASGQVAVK